VPVGCRQNRSMQAATQKRSEVSEGSEASSFEPPHIF
jgi:hypothetical protein